MRSETRAAVAPEPPLDNRQAESGLIQIAKRLRVMTEMEGVERVIENPLNFKSKLGIGEDAFAALRTKKLVGEGVRILDTAGAFGVGAAIASSSTVATTFFAPTGFLAALGIGAAAVTPIGWVIAAGVASTAGYYGISRYLRSGREDRVDIIPKWINTPLDALAVDLFGFFAPLGVKAAAVVDGRMEERERLYIESYFVREWGYSEKFVQAALPKIDSNLEIFNAVDLVNNLIEFQKGNPDCNYDFMSENLVAFLKEVTRADERLDDSEVIFIQWLENMLKAGKPGVLEKFISAVGVNRTVPAMPTGGFDPATNSEATDTIVSEKDEPSSDTVAEGLSKLPVKAVQLALFWR